MHNLSRGKATHSDRLERWLGAEEVARVSREFKDFYWPVQLNGVPGNVFVMPGGDFAGEIEVGQYMSKNDAAAVTMRKLRTRLDNQSRQKKAAGVLSQIIKAEHRDIRSLSAFASIDAVVAAFTGGKGQSLPFSKTGTASNAIGNCNDMWTKAGSPGAGAAAASAAGTALTAATVGAMAYNSIATANSGHYLNWTLSATVINSSLMLYDRLFSAVKTMNSAAAQAITVSPTRYQSVTPGAGDFIGGTFCFPSNPTTILPATAHNWASCTYLDRTGATATMQTVAGVSACVVGGVDLVVGNWFIPLAAGDIGIQRLANIQCSAAVATGTIDFVLGHPIAINCCPIANMACLDDGLYTSMNLTSIYDNACLALLELNKPATTATTYAGLIRTVSE